MPDKCPDNCPLEPRVEALERANETHSETHRELFRRLNQVETVNAVQDERYTTIDRKLDELAETVNTIAGKSGKRWDSFGEKILWFIIEAVLIVAAVKIGLR